ncbi:MAG: class I SAM-dependent methyltransferase [Woeseiaceae bacterium]|nr:class I SAM-dependent methyltransferase [Woeseiaceae bacterium]
MAKSKQLLLRFSWAIDLLVFIFVYPAALLLKLVRGLGVEALPLSKNALLNVGVFPIIDHYYEPQFDYRNPDLGIRHDRNLRGIVWNTDGQLDTLSRFRFSEELADVPQESAGTGDYYLNNAQFGSGDAEVWYQVIRAFKPKRIIEIGSGYSTLMAIKATKKNRETDAAYRCEHICIEPYERRWLEESGVTVVRERVETLPMSFFAQLEESDILFIDSSHIIRPGGDVLFEYLELLPSLNKGVIVHIHDIFSPNDYPEDWLHDMVKFWNEQYVLEAFLTHNTSWEILAALNYLSQHHYDKLKAAAPFMTPARQPGSFYIRKVG